VKTSRKRLKCLVCKRGFLSAVHWQVYCSPQCRRAHHANGFGATEAQFREAVESGMTAPQIADRFVVSADSVRVRAKYMGLTIAKASRTPEWHAKALELHKQGLLNSAIASICRMSRSAVKGVLSKYGLESNRSEPKPKPEPKRNIPQFRQRPAKSPRDYGSIIFNGPIVERVYRVIDGATIQTKRRGGSTAIGGTIVLETTDPLKAFRMVAEKAGRVKTDAKNKVLAYSIKKAPRNHS